MIHTLMGSQGKLWVYIG